MEIKEKFSAENQSVLNSSLGSELSEAFKAKDKKRLYALKKACLKDHPLETEEIEIIFGLLPALDQSEELKSMNVKKDGWEKIGAAIKRLTEYNFLLTDFIRQNGNNKEALANFWKTTETLVNGTGKSGQFSQLRRGILSQVAAWRALEGAGLNPKLSHPSEDAFESIDLWTDRGEAVQVKGAPTHDVAMIETDSIAFPGVEASNFHVNGHMFAEAQRFQAKLSKYNDQQHSDVHGYFLVVPYEEIDFVTGEPSAKVVESVKTSLNK